MAANIMKYGGLINEVQEGATITFRDIHYTVPQSHGCCSCFSPKETKSILTGVKVCDFSGVFKPGMNAIMGPTGGGKSSLLDVLAGRKDPRGLVGTVLVDGQLQPTNFQCMAGYVTQDDVIMGTLTVRENLLFSANLRLPHCVSDEQKRRRVEEVIQDLGLEACADTKVGTELIRGVSGGERKRTSIGMELITSPRVLFLDEPTTGLDAHTAYTVMQLLHGLSRRGQTIIFSIHQPRYSIFELFDSLVLLCKGRIMYHGPANQALQYFSSLNYECKQHNNPADFFLDVLSGTVQQTRSQQIQAPSAYVAENQDKSELVEFLHRTYHDSTFFSETMEVMTDHFTNSDRPRMSGRQTYTFATPFYTQLWYLSNRALLNLFRNPAATVLQMTVNVVVSLLLGLLFLRQDMSANPGLQNRIGAFFCIIMSMIFGNLSSVEPFIKTRVLFRHERGNGYYRTSTFFLSKVFCDIIPNRILPIMLFACISYWMIGLDPHVTNFFKYLLTLVLVSVAGTSVCFAISSGCTVFAVANLGVTLIYIFMMIFNGMLRNLKNMPGWCRWLKYLSIFRFGLDAVFINEFKDKMFCDRHGNDTLIQCTAGNDYLESQGIPYKHSWDFWSTQVGLATLMMAFMCIAYLQLRRINRYT